MFFSIRRWPLYGVKNMDNYNNYIPIECQNNTSAAEL